MKFYRVFRNGNEPVGPIFTSQELAVAEARKMKRDFERKVQGYISRLTNPGGTFVQDVTFVAFECDKDGKRAF
jgi:hypothetical protein